MSSHLSRRDFLRRTSGAMAALLMPPLPEDLARLTPQGLGRVTSYRINVREAPDRTAKAVGFRVFDQLLTLYGTEQGPGELEHNPVWFKIRGGYVHSSFVQPVRKELNRPLWPFQVRPERPVLLQVTMPYTDVYRQPNGAGSRTYRLYYATTHWATAVERNETKESWYKLRNDLGRGHYYARAEHLRPISADGLSAISPDVPNKRIEINLSEQRLTAYEGDEEVLTTIVSTGAVFDSYDGVERDYRTPIGTFRVLRKRASRHMRGGTPGIDYYDLPGVPWVTYFTWSGVALHGTYWHNDYGRQRSHGCVNLTPDEARWLYLWTEPAVPPAEEVLEETGTPIHVFW